MPRAKYKSHACYFLTLTVVDWVDIFIRPVYKNIIVDSLNYFIEKKGLRIYAWCLMSNHLHLVANVKESFLWTYILRELKSHTSKEVLATINEEIEPACRSAWMMKQFESPVSVTKHAGKYHFWQDGNHPVFLDADNPLAILHYINFVHENPVRCLIVDNPESYIYSSGRDYAGKKGLVNISLFNILPRTEIS